MTQRAWLENEIDETILANANASITDPVDLLMELLGKVLGTPGADVPAFVEKRVRELRPQDFEWPQPQRWAGFSWTANPR